MAKKTEKEDQITQYFFGELNEEEESRIEQQFLSDNLFFEQMLSIEEALIDDYVRGQLPEQKHRKVEKFLQSSRRHEHEIKSVERFIDDLGKIRAITAKEISPPQTEPVARWRSWFMAPDTGNLGRRFSYAGLLFTILSFGLVIWNFVLQQRLSQIDARYTELEKRNQELVQRFESQTNNNQDIDQRIEDIDKKSNQIEQEVSAIKESRSTSYANDTVTLALTMQSLTRDGGKLQVVPISPRKNWLRIQIHLGKNEPTSYTAKIETFEGELIWSKNDLKPTPGNPDKITINLPVRLFPSADYTLTLNGRKSDGSSIEIGNYSFRTKE